MTSVVPIPIPSVAVVDNGKKATVPWYNYFRQFSATAASASAPSFVDVMDYGVKADGTTDDTTALQNAINAAWTKVPVGGAVCVALPPGQIILSGTIVIDGQNLRTMSMSGCGQLTTRFTRSTNYGDTFQILRVPQGHFSDFGVISLNERTSGTDLELTNIFEGLFENIMLKDWFGGIKLNGCISLLFDNVRGYSGAIFTDPVVKGGTFGFKIAADTGFGTCNAIMLSNCNFGPTSGNNKISDMMVVEAIDGLWVTNLTLGPGAHFNLLKVEPPVGATVGGMHFDRLWTDFSSLTGVNINIANGSTARGIFFTNFTMEGSVNQLVLASASAGSALRGLGFTNGGIVDCSGFGLIANGVDGLCINNVHFEGNQGTPLVLGPNTTNSTIVSNNVVSVGGAGSIGIQVQAGATNNIITSNRVRGAVTANIQDGGTGTVLANNITL